MAGTKRIFVPGLVFLFVFWGVHIFSSCHNGKVASNSSVSPSKKVLFVASYDSDKDEWTAGILEGIESVFPKEKGVHLTIRNMDSKMMTDDRDKKAAALKARELIGSLKPDLVIISDDNAAKFLLMPYFRDASIPFVFCGINWDVSDYALPYSNTTGMIEV